MNNKGARLAGRVRLNSLAIGLTIIAIAMGTILFFQTLALSKLETELNGQQLLISQTKNLTTSLDKSSQQSAAQVDELNRHLDCIVVFFSQPDRTQKAISDIDTCTLQTISANVPHQTTAPTTRTAVPSQISTNSSSPKSTSSGSSSPVSGGATNPTGGSSSPSFLDKTLVTPLNKNIVQPIKNLLNDIL